MHRVLLAAIALALAAVLLTSSRPWAATNRPMILPVQELPGPAQAKLRRFLGMSGVLLPRDVATGGSDAATETPVRLGYSYREFSGFRMPFAGYTDLGLVLYDEAPEGRRMVPLDADYLKLLASETGVPITADYRFPWWRFLWGWLFVAALLVWYGLQRRADERRRIASGNM